MEEKYVLISLEDEKAEKLANVLANKTSKKILDLLAEKELSESGIAKELKMPLNTVGYNINNLISAGLIEEKKHLWSIKGKRIPVYKISNKYIIISPRKKRVGGIFPVVVLAGIFSIFILWYQKFIEKTEELVVKEAAPLMQAGEKAAEETAKIGFKLGAVGIFLIIIWLAVLIFILISVRRYKNGQFS